MKLHRNAALSWSGRRRMAERVLVEGWGCVPRPVVAFRNESGGGQPFGTFTTLECTALSPRVCLSASQSIQSQPM